MARPIEGFASDRGIRSLNLELRKLQEDPRRATSSYVRIIRTMHGKLLHLSAENIDIKEELDMTKEAARMLNDKLAEQYRLQALKEAEKNKQSQRPMHYDQNWRQLGRRTMRKRVLSSSCTGMPSIIRLR
ncbi:uncharacterized protein M421DRAFT_389695 [Didymella exigua CBS 183.55]|uniref:Uncharacterized protein n=1 Tax=Didymella exigua CBS 183.55 TaxID=1150837 RepID=A0A6A5RQZ4_9PLEO|nr:uncharacterized protein M421DRAFT_389695 [Didymella exigua CBS 183.55]KAF1929873.1 hypothetical protein M421DRAFT_389695 [Didymella exigua CBS 183.55]